MVDSHQNTNLCLRKDYCYWHILVVILFLFLTKTIEKEERGKIDNGTFSSVLSEYEFGGCITVPSVNLFSSQTTSQYDTIYHDCHPRLKRKQK